MKTQKKPNISALYRCNKTRYNRWQSSTACPQKTPTPQV